MYILAEMIGLLLLVVILAIVYKYRLSIKEYLKDSDGSFHWKTDRITGASRKVEKAGWDLKEAEWDLEDAEEYLMYQRSKVSKESTPED